MRIILKNPIKETINIFGQSIEIEPAPLPCSPDPVEDFTSINTPSGKKAKMFIDDGKIRIIEDPQPLDAEIQKRIDKYLKPINRAVRIFLKEDRQKREIAQRLEKQLTDAGYVSVSASGFLHKDRIEAGEVPVLLQPQEAHIIEEYMKDGRIVLQDGSYCWKGTSLNLGYFAKDIEWTRPKAIAFFSYDNGKTPSENAIKTRMNEDNIC